MNEKLNEFFSNYTNYIEPQRNAISETIKIVQMMSNKDNLNWVIQQLYSRSNKSNSQNNLLTHYIDMFNNIMNIYNAVEELGDNEYTLHVMQDLGRRHIFPDELNEILCVKHLINMVEYNQVIPQAIKSNFITKDQIEWIFDYIEKTQHGVNLTSLLNNKKMTSNHLDRLAFYLKNNNYVHLDAPMWLNLLLHPNINFLIIKNHLSEKSLKELFKSQSTKCFQIVIQQNQNKPEIDKLALLDAFPFLKEHGLEASHLHASIEILGGHIE